MRIRTFSGQKPLGNLLGSTWYEELTIDVGLERHVFLCFWQRYFGASKVFTGKAGELSMEASLYRHMDGSARTLLVNGVKNNRLTFGQTYQ